MPTEAIQLQRCQRCGTLQLDGSCELCGPNAQAVGKPPLFLGAFDLPRGFFFLLGNPGLWPWVILPFLTNCGLWFLLYIFVVKAPIENWLKPWLERTDTGPSWLMSMTGVGLEVAFTAAFAVVALALFGFFGSIVNAPFYDFLSEAAEKRHLGGLPPSGGGSGGFLARFIRSFISSAKITLHILFWYVLWLPLMLIPPPIGQILYFFAMARLRTLELMAFPLARKVYGLREMRAFMRGIYWHSFALGATLNLCILLPTLVFATGGFLFYPIVVLTGLIGWMASPIAVVSATLRYLDSPK